MSETIKNSIGAAAVIGLMAAAHTVIYMVENVWF